MATQPDDWADDEADDPTLDLEDEADDADVEDDADDQPANDDDQPQDDEDVISFGGAEATGEVESEGVRNLRARLKEVEREKRDLERQVSPKADEVGTKPNIDDYWDKPEEFETDLLAWSDRKRNADADAARREEAGRAQAERWQAQEREFEGSWSSLRNEAKHAARAKVEEAFSPEQQAMLVKAARGNGAGLFFMLGSSGERLAELKKLANDPVEFVATAAVMAKDIQVTKRAPKTQPESVHRGSGGTVRGSDAKMQRLEAEADKTGDYSKVVAHMAARKGAK